jgi:hypothetical protein
MSKKKRAKKRLRTGYVVNRNIEAQVQTTMFNVITRPTTKEPATEPESRKVTTGRSTDFMTKGAGKNRRSKRNKGRSIWLVGVGTTKKSGSHRNQA